MKDRGIIFSIDLAVSVIVMALMVYLILVQASNVALQSASIEREFELQRKGLFILDSLIKNSDENNPSLGAAHYNPELMRVEQNVLDYALLGKIRENKELLDGLNVLELYLLFKDGSKELLFKGNAGKNCTGFERFAVVKAATERKAKIVLVICDE